MTTWAGGEPFYDPFYCHEKYDGKLYEVDRGRRRGLHLYLHRIYFCDEVVDKSFTRGNPSARGGLGLDVANKKQAR